MGMPPPYYAFPMPPPQVGPWPDMPLMPPPGHSHSPIAPHGWAAQSPPSSAPSSRFREHSPPRAASSSSRSTKGDFYRPDPARDSSREPPREAGRDAVRDSARDSRTADSSRAKEAALPSSSSRDAPRDQRRSDAPPSSASASKDAVRPSSSTSGSVRILSHCSACFAHSLTHSLRTVEALLPGARQQQARRGQVDEAGPVVDR